MREYDLAIVGGGAAGLVAAWAAASEGAKVVVLEKMEKTARKVRISGKGRCNITNECRYDEFLSKVNTNPAFFRWAFSSFPQQAIVDLLEKYGVKTVVERGDRIFPESGHAWDVATALLDAATDAGADVHTFKEVVNIGVTNDKVTTIEFRDSERGHETVMAVKAIILATGGKSYPRTGSTGDGYAFLEKLGHHIVTPLPSLVPLKVKQIEFSKLIGLQLRNVEASLEVEGTSVASEFGEVEFLDNGLGGSAILRMSRQAVLALEKGQNVGLTLDLKSALSNEQLIQRIRRDVKSGEFSTTEELLMGLLPKKLVKPFATFHKIGLKKQAAELNDTDISKIARTLKSTRLNVGGTAGFDGAIVTMGGVSLKNIDPKTMQSKRVKGLYVAGELLDLDGPTGGYNLQIAFSTGYLAGKSAAKWLRE
jgi:predicted Rossmann fold flavoprotein